MEEVLFAECLDLAVEPVKKGCITLGNRRCDSILTSESRDTYNVAFILKRVCDNFGIVICPCNTCSVFK